MSVGVCIINRNGIALAADSAETRTVGDKKMFYNSVNKVFNLSEKYPYAAIMCGNLYIGNVFVEQLFREFQVYLDTKEDIEDFFEIIAELEKFINMNYTYYKFDKNEEEHCKWLIKAKLEEWAKKIQNCFGEADAEKSIDEILNELKNEIKILPKLKNFNISQDIKRKYQTEYDILVDSIIPELKKYATQKDSLWECICEFFNLTLEREINNRTEILLAGYGKNDAFPKYIHIDVYRIINHKIKYNEKGRKDNSDVSSQIYPIGQDDVIMTFCKGISQSYIDKIPQKAKKMIDDKIDGISDSVFTDEQKEKLKNTFSSCDNDFRIAISNQSRLEFIDPIIDALQTLPLPEMAFLAESLVNLTSLKRTYSIDGNQQTVGGPTDVAILSKGNGYEWIKQK